MGTLPILEFAVSGPKKKKKWIAVRLAQLIHIMDLPFECSHPVSANVFMKIECARTSTEQGTHYTNCLVKTFNMSVCNIWMMLKLVIPGP